MTTVSDTHISIKRFLEAEELLPEKQFFNFIDEYEENNLPYICNEVSKLLADNGCYFMISKENKKVLARLAKVTLDVLFDPDNSKLALDKVIPHGRIETYQVSAAYGVRPATANEVGAGVEGLIPQYVYPAGQDAYKHLCLMYWALTGRSWYYRQTGHNLVYNKETGKVESTLIEILTDCMDDYIEMLRFVSNTDMYNKAIKIIKKYKRNGFKYADYAKDEITEEISVKQLVKNIAEKFPRNSDNKNFRKAIALVIKTNVHNKRLSPMEIAELRKIYREFLSDHKNYEKKQVNEATKEQCETLIKNRALLGADHFVYKIVSTFQRCNYIVKPSEKQQRIIEDALEKIRIEQEKKKASTIITEDEIDKNLEETDTIATTETNEEENKNREPLGDSFFDDIDHMYDMLNSGIFGSED